MDSASAFVGEVGDPPGGPEGWSHEQARDRQDQKLTIEEEIVAQLGALDQPMHHRNLNNINQVMGAMVWTL